MSQNSKIIIGDKQKSKIIENLRILSEIEIGDTLSTSTMKKIHHNSWSSSLWRTYAGENRSDTVQYIKGLLNETIFVMEFCDDELCFLLHDELEKALKGVLNLSVTYERDYYTVSEIERITSTTKYKAHNITEKKLLVSCGQLINSKKQNSEPVVNNNITGLQKNSPTRKFEPNSDQMVTISNRTTGEKTNKDQCGDDHSINNQTTDSVNDYIGETIDNVISQSNNTSKNVITASNYISDEINKKKNFTYHTNMKT